MSRAHVQIKEIDLTTRVPSFPGVYGAIIIDAPRGPVGVPTLVTSETQLLERYTEFGEIRVGHSTAFYSARAFLEKSDKLWVTRPDNDPSFGGVLVKKLASGSTDSPFVPLTVDQVIDPKDFVFGEDDIMLVVGSDPGEWNNQLQIAITDYSHKEPGSFAINLKHGSKFESPLICSRDESHKDGYNRNIYVESMGDHSNLVSIYDNPFMPADTAIPFTVEASGAPKFTYFTGGDAGDAVTTGMHMLAMDEFRGRDTYPCTVMLDGGHSVPPYQRHLIKLCEDRKDCIALLSIPYEVEAHSDYLNEIVSYVRNDLNASNSFASIYCSHLKIYDKFTDRYIYVSAEGYVGAIISETAANSEIWYPPAGFRRGKILVQDVLRRFKDGEMDYLYDNNINPIRFAPGKGIVVWGQKTLLRRPSSLDRLNVRLLLIVIEPAIAEALDDFLFEFNDASTRKQIEVLIDGYMEGIKARRGVYDFMVKCDEENNPPNVIDENRMVVHLFIKPARSAEFIDFYVVLTPTGMSFGLAEDLVGIQKSGANVGGAY